VSTARISSLAGVLAGRRAHDDEAAENGKPTRFNVAVIRETKAFIQAVASTPQTEPLRSARPSWEAGR
jgi:hypothetical protein